MMPDKVYVTEITGSLHIRRTPDTLFGKPLPEYIRKDALLEWAKETYLAENASAIRKVCFKQLIDKLNSL